jgi:hypothetical protein
MKQIQRYCLALMETVRRLGEQAQAARGCDTTSGDAPSPERFAPGVYAQHPQYSQGLRSKTMGQEAPRASKPTQRADACAAFSSLLIVCAWCQQYMRWQPVALPMPLTISHGICARCYAQVSSEIEH